MMKLYLVQHGEAENKETNSERPLTEKGHNDIRKLSQFLNQSDIQLDQVIHSGKLRAKETAEYFVKMLTNPSSSIENSNINPNDSLEPLIAEIQSWSNDTLIVGHLPYLAKLVSYLTTGNDSSLTASFQPGTAICLQRDEDMKWQLNWMIRPELLGN
jgi:phosphohistidine phosphatase